jgi:hypothetical protein
LDLIYDLAERAAELYTYAGERGHDATFRDMVRSVFCDLITCHADCCPLRLKELSEAPITDFVHDIMGIRRNLERGKRRLKGGFIPRYAAVAA